VSELVKVDASMFDAIYDHLLRDLDPEIPPERWRRIFDCDWARSEEHRGYALVDQGVPVGFVGLIFADIRMNGTLERFCNVTTWTVRETHRAKALSLVMPIRKLKGYTITNFTATPRVHQIFSGLGFRDLDTHTTVLHPLPSLRFGSARARISFDPEEIRRDLADAERRILDAHRSYAEHLLVTAGDETCYVVYTVGRRRKLRTARIHYLSDQAVFADNIRSIQTRLLLHAGTYFTEFDSRLLKRRIPFSQSIPMAVPRLYKSDTLEPSQISNLFSEVVLLNF
jgi:hypothetical protein